MLYYLFFFFLYLAAFCLASGVFLFSYFGVSLENLGFGDDFIFLVQSMPRIAAIFLIIIIWKKLEKMNRLHFFIFSGICGIVCFLGMIHSENPYYIILFSSLHSFVFFSVNTLVSVLVKYTSEINKKASIIFFTSSTSLGSFISPKIVDKIQSLNLFPNVNVAGVFAMLLAFIGVISLLITKICTFYLDKNTEAELYTDNESELNIKAYSQLIPLSLMSGMVFFTAINSVVAYVHGLLQPSLFFIGFGLLAIGMRVFLASKISTWKTSYVLFCCLLTFFMSFLLLLLLPLYPFDVVLFLSGAFLGMAQGTIWPVMSSMFIDVTPKTPTTATAALIFFYVIGGGLMPALLGLVTRFFGYQYMYSLILIFITLFIVYIMYNNKFNLLLLSLDKKHKDLRKA